MFDYDQNLWSTSQLGAMSAYIKPREYIPSLIWRVCQTSYGVVLQIAQIQISWFTSWSFSSIKDLLLWYEGLPS